MIKCVLLNLYPTPFITVWRGGGVVYSQYLTRTKVSNILDTHIVWILLVEQQIKILCEFSQNDKRISKMARGQDGPHNYTGVHQPQCFMIPQQLFCLKNVHQSVPGAEWIQCPSCKRWISVKRVEKYVNVLLIECIYCNDAFVLPSKSD